MSMSVYVRMADPPPVRVEMLPIRESAFLRMPEDLVQEILLISGQNFGLLNRAFLLRWHYKETKAIENLNQNYVLHVLFPGLVVSRINLREICQRVQQLFNAFSKSQAVHLDRCSILLLASRSRCEEMMSALARTLLSHKVLTFDSRGCNGIVLGPLASGALIFSIVKGINTWVIVGAGGLTLVGIPMTSYFAYSYAKVCYREFYWRKGYQMLGGRLREIQDRLSVSPSI